MKPHGGTHRHIYQGISDGEHLTVSMPTHTIHVTVRNPSLRHVFYHVCCQNYVRNRSLRHVFLPRCQNYIRNPSLRHVFLLRCLNYVKNPSLRHVFLLRCQNCVRNPSLRHIFLLRCQNCVRNPSLRHVFLPRLSELCHKYPVKMLMSDPCSNTLVCSQFSLTSEGLISNSDC